MAQWPAAWFRLPTPAISDTKRFVLAHGFGFSIPNNNFKIEEVFAEFELLYEQLSKQYVVSIEADQVMKSRLCDLAYAYSGGPKRPF